MDCTELNFVMLHFWPRRGRDFSVSAQAHPGIRSQSSQPALEQEQWLLRRSLLSTLEAFAASQPKDLLATLDCTVEKQIKT